MAEFDRIFGCNLGKPRCSDVAGLTTSPSHLRSRRPAGPEQTHSWRARSGAACDARQCLAAAPQGKRAECAARPSISATPDRACEVSARSSDAALILPFVADFGQAAFRQQMEEADIREDLHGLCKAVRSRRSNSNHRSYEHQSHIRNDRPDYATSRMWL